ncbi:hypothetical protein DJ568_00315 [Mucilaginibacter hurinus]|uniref:Uncharacterized protein n=1 Tax=Mucilaginibacter hurinus TaxID=2201324 RepID=A0A367GSW4_9SPHI|nr:hypothetical protein [Mucilaginibacter hurinus]RCH56340.1 hypothetical protein DJ568_00315 [Mucilaginibacter hurinus]
MPQLKSDTFLREEAKAWLNRNNGASEVIRVVPSYAPVGHQCYELYTAYDTTAENLGRILFDQENYWIYDGDNLSVAEQEQIAGFIINYIEKL